MLKILCNHFVILIDCYGQVADYMFCLQQAIYKLRFSPHCLIISITLCYRHMFVLIPHIQEWSSHILLQVCVCANTSMNLVLVLLYQFSSNGFIQVRYLQFWVVISEDVVAKDDIETWFTGEWEDLRSLFEAGFFWVLLIHSFLDLHILFFSGLSHSDIKVSYSYMILKNCIITWLKDLAFLQRFL